MQWDAFARCKRLFADRKGISAVLTFDFLDQVSAGDI